MLLFTQTADAVSATTKKLEKIRLLADLLRSLPLEDATQAAIFLTGRAFPHHEERVLGIGGSTLYRLVAELTGKTSDELSAIYRKHGDLGDVAEEALRDLRAGQDIQIAEVAATFENLAALRHPAQKSAALKALLEKSSPADVKYIIKIITGDLRIGLKESLVEEAIAKAFDRPATAVRRANMLTGDIGKTLFLAAADQLASATMVLFHPIGFMLATAVETAAELFDAKQTQFFVEEKYDGIRAQIHKRAGRTKIFSRTLDEVTEFPELIAPIAALPGEFILDGEILAWQDAHPLPFTELQKRLGRKTTQMNLWTQHEIPVKFVAFDLLYLNSELLLDFPFRERRTKLATLFSSSLDSAIQLATPKLGDSVAAVESAFRDSLAAGHEGIVAKDPDSLYTPGRRGGNWFKLKEPFATLDVVVTAVEYGHGKRHGVLSDYTFAVRSGELLLNIGKAYSGLTDAEIAEYTEYFLQHTTEDQGFRRIVEPTVVIEVAFNNMQKSNRHASGYALRFPRIVRFRPDKPVAEIDTLARVEELYAMQTTLPSSSRKKETET
ncbi:MAG TPA: ATP-dependent DNA ligase [Candidatus Dormibacteraeota bacterium]|nr:ATP-dependent DNA ligase [Candidatus Dormibacteraeota bacterium]